MLKALLTLFVFTIISCNSNDRHLISKVPDTTTYDIKGNILNKDTGWAYLGKYDTITRAMVKIFDSAEIAGSQFHFHGKLATPLICKIMIRTPGWPYTHYFVLDSGTTNVQLYYDSMGNSLVKGTTLQNQYNLFSKKEFDLDTSFEKYYSLNQKRIISDDSLDKLKKAFLQKKYSLILQQIRSNPNAITSAFIARSVLTDEVDLSTFQEVADALHNSNNFFARQIMKALEATKQTHIGFMAPHFKIIDNKNATFTNSSFKGKYLLLDFWASWCIPCRAESPYLVKAYKKYHDKGLEILSISSDNNLKEWQKAIKKDKLTWIQADKFIGSNDEVSADFAVSLIPSNFLIDTAGIIVAKELRGNNLEKALKEQLGK